MGRKKIVNCKRCGGHVDKVGPLSVRKLCLACAESAVTAANLAMHTKSGSDYEAWAQGMQRWAGNLNTTPTPPTTPQPGAKARRAKP